MEYKPVLYKTDKDSTYIIRYILILGIPKYYN